MLIRIGTPFWQEETYDHEVRHQREFERIRYYIENNPVCAGLVLEACQYRWSNASWPTWGSPRECDMKVTIREVSFFVA